MSSNILIVDDEADIRKLVQGILEDEGYETRSVSNAQETYATIKEKRPALIILDIWLQGSEHDGLEILARVKDDHPYIPVIMISGHGTIETAVSAIKQGAYDFIEKPFKSDRLILMVQRALENAALRKENEQLRKSSDVVTDLLGGSPVITNIKQIIDRVAPTNSRILIRGEPGTGKDVTARVIHQKSDRADQPFLTLNCATMRPEKLEVELFGGEGEQTGLLQRANGGTILLDEISDMPLETQGKVVRVLQEQRFQVKPGAPLIDIDIRFIATTNRDLEEAMKEGRFRQDLFYRLNVVPIMMPPLRERKHDIEELALHFMGGLCSHSGLPCKTFAPSAVNLMKSYDWPGNIRQLRNVVEWVLIMNGHRCEDAVEAQHLPPELQGKSSISPINIASSIGEPVNNSLELPLREARETFERDYLQSQLKRFEGNISKTAQFIGMERSALHRKLKSLDILNDGKIEDERKRAQA